MDKQDKKQTKWGWGLVALAGLLAATTIDGNIIITAASAAVFALGAWRGGYMTEDARRKTAGRETNLQERRAA